MIKLNCSGPNVELWGIPLGTDLQLCHWFWPSGTCHLACSQSTSLSTHSVHTPWICVCRYCEWQCQKLCWSQVDSIDCSPLIQADYQWNEQPSLGVAVLLCLLCSSPWHSTWHNSLTDAYYADLSNFSLDSCYRGLCRAVFAPSSYYCTYNLKIDCALYHIIVLHLTTVRGCPIVQGMSLGETGFGMPCSDPNCIGNLSGMVFECLRMLGVSVLWTIRKQTWNSQLQVNIGSSTASKIQ